MDTAEALAEIDALKSVLEDACVAIIARAEQGVIMTTDSAMHGIAVADVFSEIMVLCSFQDLAGQRLTRLSQALIDGPGDTRPDAHLLNGPANTDGLDQAAADALFENP